MSAAHTPYDRLTDDEFVTLLERQEESDLLNSVIKRLTIDRKAAFDDACSDAYDEGVEVGENSARHELKERILAAFE